jgi:DNA-binding transcriptional LysR family regulator
MHQPTWLLTRSLSVRRASGIGRSAKRGQLRSTVWESAYLAAVEGLGVVLTTLAAFRREFASGVLLQVLPEWDLGSVEVHGVCTNGRAAKPLTRAVVAYLAGILPRARGLLAHQPDVQAPACSSPELVDGVRPLCARHWLD